MSVSFNVLGDHGYTKPATELLYAAPDNANSSDLLNPHDSTKLTALFEETKECTQHDLFPADFMDVLPYCDGNEMTNSTETSYPDIEAVLDSIINGDNSDDSICTDMGMPSPVENSDIVSDDSGVSLCGSPISLDMPSPSSENSSVTFFSPATDCSDFFEGDQFDLFPQLSVM